MFAAGVLAFSVAVPLVSYAVAKHGSRDPGYLAASLSLVAWGAMMIGLLLAKVSP